MNGHAYWCQHARNCDGPVGGQQRGKASPGNRAFLGRQGVSKHVHQVNKLEWFPEEALDTRPREDSFNSFPTVGAGEDYFQIGTGTPGFLEDF